MPPSSGSVAGAESMQSAYAVHASRSETATAATKRTARGDSLATGSSADVTAVGTAAPLSCIVPQAATISGKSSPTAVQRMDRGTRCTTAIFPGMGYSYFVVRRVAAVLLASVVLTAAACNSLTGADDLAVLDHASEPSGDGGSSGTSGTSGTSGSSGTTDSGTTDSGTTDDGGLAPAPDFKLGSCGSNLLCVPNTDGWSPLASFLTLGGNACPAEWPTAASYQTSGGGSCVCTCGPQGGSCAGSVTIKSGVACTGPTTILALTSGTCTDPPMPTTVTLPASFSPHLSGSAPTSCTATVKQTLNGPRTANTCSGVVGVPSDKCEAGEICVRRASSAGSLLQTCLVHDGEVGCPQKLPNRKVIATAVADGRSCGTSCACSPTSCSNGATLEAYSAAGCSSSVRTVNVDGTCITAGAAPSGPSYFYTPGTGCGVTTPAPVLGKETYTGARTLCCGFGF